LAVRLGCGGCLSTVALLLVIGLVAGGGAWALVRCLDTPEVERVSIGPEDGPRAQQKIFGLVRRGAQVGPVVFSEAEINALVTRHLEPADLPLRDAIVRLRGSDLIDVTGTVPLGRLLHESPLAPLSVALPGGWLERPIWLALSARTRMSTEPRHAIRLDVRTLVIGRQRVPAILLRLILEPASLRLTQIPLPPGVQAVHVERGRVILQVTSTPSRI
jgi:hypothetical protein